MATHIAQSQLIELIEREHQTLMEAVANVPARARTQAGVTDGGWSVKDLLAHLTAWEQMFLGWYRAGVKGETPETPAPGLTWSAANLNKLNDRIYKHGKRLSLAEVQRQFDASYAETLAQVKRMTNDELDTPLYYAWTGKGLLSGSVTANTWRHYRWARTLIVKWMRKQKRAEG